MEPDWRMYRLKKVLALRAEGEPASLSPLTARTRTKGEVGTDRKQAEWLGNKCMLTEQLAKAQPIFSFAQKSGDIG